MTTKPFARILLLSLLLLAGVAAAEDMTVDDIIAKNAETRGGLDALQGVQTAKMTGKMNMGGMELPISMTFKRPNKIRFEMEMQGQKILQVYDGEKGWGIMPMMGSTEPEYLAGDQLNQVKQMADVIEGPMINYEEKGHSVELVGKEEVEGTEAYKIKLTTADGREIYNYLDTEYFLIFKQESSVSMQGTEIKGSASISDYKEVGPIVLSHAMEQSFEGAPPGAGMTITLENIELDTEVDDSIFMFPEKEETEEGSEGEESKG